MINEENQQIYSMKWAAENRGRYKPETGGGMEREPTQHPDKKKRAISFDEVTDFLQEGKRIGKEYAIGQKEATWLPEVEYPGLPILLLLASDIHYGSTQVDYDLLKKHIKIVEDTPNTFIATNGDLVDNFNPVKHASGMLENPIPPVLQTRAFLQKFLELDRGGKVAVIGHGNHDLFGAIAGEDWFDSYMADFTAPIFDKGGILNIVTVGAKYRMIMNHTYWGKSKLNITNAPKRLLTHEAGGTCDIGWLGHTHTSAYEMFTQAGRELLAVVSGTYKQDDKWAAQVGIGLKPGMPGICLALWQDEKKMEVFKDIASAQDWMMTKVFEIEQRKEEKTKNLEWIKDRKEKRK